ncbi:hypothetical protein BHU72_14185 [Desulfuribacillus stibiiarsenatis]|uniref:Spore germination GerD central core domain-containing protein n=1 Tax=Desulfuribacillus stibiiarsenatis TaxID=1390249 RepID=A0A1E5L8B6_9FIRM|nr:spore germination lipoprotein GerD [Desulfuribacillus stibiiarsenatis]OEH86366.1 hypothetical protein BHU72_14185 [Desulfuribacillus stibiiarsenatis]
MMNHKKTKSMKIGLALSIITVFLYGCSPAQRPEDSKQNYQDTKQMVVDSLGSKEGREAIKNLLKDPEIKKEIIIEDADVKSAVAESILDPKNRKVLESALKDPKFAADFAKNVQEQHKELLKNLMLDPDYRELMIQVFSEPDFQKMLTEQLKGSAMRKQMQEAAKEAFLTPAARLELMEMLRKIQKEELEIQIKEDAGGGGGEEEGGGGEGGAGSGGEQSASVVM